MQFLILALIALALLACSRRVRVLASGHSVLPNPSSVTKSKVIDTYAAEAVAAGSFYGDEVEVPRGAFNFKFSLTGTLFDATTGDEDYQFFIQGRDGPNGNWFDIPGLAFTLREGVTSGDETVPSAANAPGVVLPRYIRAKLVTVGTTPIATATVTMHYESSGRGGGKDASPGYVGG